LNTVKNNTCGAQPERLRTTPETLLQYNGARRQKKCILRSGGAPEGGRRRPAGLREKKYFLHARFRFRLGPKRIAGGAPRAACCGPSSERAPTKDATGRRHAGLSCCSGAPASFGQHTRTVGVTLGSVTGARSTTRACDGGSLPTRRGVHTPIFVVFAGHCAHTFGVATWWCVRWCGH
jgi:hypothetical protein